MNNYRLYKSIQAKPVLPGVSPHGLGEKIVIKAGENIVVDSSMLNGATATVVITYNGQKHLADRKLVLDAVLD